MPRAMWSIEVAPTTPGWMRLPAGMTPAQRTSWIAETMSELQTTWGDDWGPEVERIVRTHLDQAASLRDDDMLLELLYWPYYRPLAARVSIQVGNSLPPQHWDEAGFRVTAYDGAAVGPGIQCVDTSKIDLDGATATLVHARYVFDDGRSSVVVTVHPTLNEVFAHLAAGLHGLIGNMDVQRPDGTSFASGAVTGVSTAPVDQWNYVDD